MARVVHFEIPVEQPARARAFYEAALGWAVDGSGGGYWLATTGGEAERGVDGALIERSAIHAAPVLIVGVPSVAEALDRVERAGGTVVRGKREIPGTGYAAYVRDPEGNVLGLFEPMGPDGSQDS